MMPELHTFRRSADDDYVTTIDGMMLPRSVAIGGSVTALEPLLDSCVVRGHARSLSWRHNGPLSFVCA